MNHYKIKIAGVDGTAPVEVELEKPDDIAALNSALEICRQQTVEVWHGDRQIGAVSLSGTPQLVF